MCKLKLSKVEKSILIPLLDAYERKKESTNRRIIIKADKFKAYDLNHIEKKKIFISAVQRLSDEGLIQFEWKRFEENNLLERIILVEDAIFYIYEAVGRVTKENRIKYYLEELADYQKDNENEWLQDFLEDERKFINKNGRWSAIWPSEHEGRSELVCLLKIVDKGCNTSMRYLSVRLYGDSKKIERDYKSKLTSIAKKYISLNLDEGELLDFLGILVNPVEVLVYGPLTYCLDEREISLKPFVYGNSVNSATVEHMSELMLETNAVLTIENKATYYEFIKNAPKNVFVIYLGGFFGKTAAQFLIKLKELDGISFYHWSDIDLGGLRIYRYLMDILDGVVKPFGMGVDLYIYYIENNACVDIIPETHLKEIKEMMGMQEMVLLHDTMKMLLHHKRRLEQECIDIEDILTGFVGDK